MQDWFRTLLHAWLRRFHVEPRRDLEQVLHRTARRIGGGCRLERLYRDYAWYGVVSAPA
jgi:S-adenosylmethionine-diacylgycerolhomoserine-N-methlytransferase